MDCPHATPPLPASPPSVERVLCALAGRGPMTMKDLQSDSGLARRTVYAAVRRLRTLGVIAERVSLRDTRQTLYWIPV